MDLDAPVQLTLEDVRACMSERGLLELDLATERATNRKLREAMANLINAGQPQAPDAGDEPAVEES